MTDTKKIKIVKRLDASASKVKNTKIDSSRVKAREMVSNVSEWVTDLKLRKSNETRAALDSLFSTNPHPIET